MTEVNLISLDLMERGGSRSGISDKLVCYDYELGGSSNERTEESTEGEKHSLQGRLTDSEFLPTIAFRIPRRG